jgi:hypothetical protein
MANLSSFYPQPIVAGTTEGTFAEGDDARIVGALPAATAGTGSVLASGSSNARTLSNRFADAVNVKDFGAVGNNSADDGPAIRAAIAHAIANDKSVYFPKATYLIETTTTGATMPLTTGIHSLIDCTNNSATEREIVILGDGATIRSAMYPTIYTGQWNIGYGVFQSLFFLKIEGNYKRVFVSGISLVSDRPLQQGDRWNSPPLTTTLGGSVLAANPSPTNAHGRVYGFYFTKDASLRPPKNITIEDVSIVDAVCGIRFDGGKDININRCSFLYNYGTTSTGVSELAVGIYNFVKDIDYMKVTNCLFDGHVNSDANPASSTYTDKRAADGFIVTLGTNLDGGDNTGVVISTNTVRRFMFEGIMTLGSEVSTYTTPNVPPLLITNNTIDGRLPSNHPSSTASIPSLGNLGIVAASSNTNISSNAILGCTTGILISSGSNQPNRVAAYNCISNNTIILPSTNISTSPIGISLASKFDNNDVIGNQITGAGVTASDMQGWDGVSELVNVGANLIKIPKAILIAGTPPTREQYAGAPFQRILLQSNVFRIVSKAANTATAMLEMGGTVGMLVTSKNNTYDGWDYLSFRSGGARGSFLSIDDTIRGITRINSNYVASQFDDAAIIRGSHEFKPLATGWYRMLFRSVGSFGGKIKISTAGFGRFGDTTIGVDNNSSYQHSELDVQSWEGTSASKRWVSKIRHIGGAGPAITKFYIRQSNGDTQIFLYVNKVTSKLTLTFGGGGPAAAATGYAEVTAGVITNVEVTSGGSGYQSNPSISITDPVRYQVSGSGAVLTPTVAGGIVTGVTVTNGGSGYVQPIVLEYETNEASAVFAHNGLQSWPVSVAAPSGGTELAFLNGERTIEFDGTNLLGSGDPTVATSAPTSVTPDFIGQQYINTVSGIAYIATGTSSSSDWKALAT